VLDFAVDNPGCAFAHPDANSDRQKLREGHAPADFFLHFPDGLLDALTRTEVTANGRIELEWKRVLEPAATLECKRRNALIDTVHPDVYRRMPIAVTMDIHSFLRLPGRFAIGG
jgi:hypothetical protein